MNNYRSLNHTGSVSRRFHPEDPVWRLAALPAAWPSSGTGCSRIARTAEIEVRVQEAPHRAGRPRNSIRSTMSATSEAVIDALEAHPALLQDEVPVLVTRWRRILAASSVAIIGRPRERVAEFLS